MTNETQKLQMKMSKIRKKFLDAILDAGLADSDILTRKQILEIVQSKNLKHPHWLTNNLRTGVWGEYHNPLKAVEFMHKPLPVVAPPES